MEMNVLSVLCVLQCDWLSTARDGAYDWQIDIHSSHVAPMFVR